MLSLTNVMRLDKGQYKLVRALCRYSKNLNQDLYQTRQYFFENNSFLQYPKNYHLCKESENYKMLQANTAQQTLKFVERGMRSWFGCKGIVHLGVSKAIIKDFPDAHRQLCFTLPKPLEGKEINEIHILSLYGGLCFKIKYCYESENEIVELDSEKYLSIDLGLSNFATFVDNATGTATIIDGMYVKSLNQWYNKEDARLQAIKDRAGIEYCTEKQYRLTWRRANRLNEFMNRAVNHIIKHCIANKIGNVLIGELKGIKQGINHGRAQNQSFVTLPYGKFKAKLESKCERYGIKYKLVSEAYTSRTDALAFDEIKDQPYGKSRRTKRGLYQSITGTLVNADVNGALNILRNVAGDSPAKEIISSGLVNRPTRIRIAFEQAPA